MSRQQEQAAMMLTVCMCAVFGVALIMGCLVAYAEIRWPWVAWGVRCVFYSAFVMSLVYLVWMTGRRFERKYGGCKCGVRSADETLDARCADAAQRCGRQPGRNANTGCVEKKAGATC